MIHRSFFTTNFSLPVNDYKKQKSIIGRLSGVLREYACFNLGVDAWNKFLIYSIVIIINYCTFAFCAFFGFSKKKLLAISGIIIFLATILGYIFAWEFGGWGISDEDDYILFSILLLIFGLTNNIYPLFENKKKHDDIAFLLEDFKIYYAGTGKFYEQDFSVLLTAFV